MSHSDNKPQILWVGLSFLAVGLLFGLLLSTSKPMLQAQDEEAVVPELDIDTLETVTVSADNDAILGNTDAPVTIVEFSDFQCPFCEDFYRKSLPQIMDKYIVTGKVKLVYRDYPIEKHPEASPAAQTAECVRKYSSDAPAVQDENYYKMHDLLFENVSAWSGNPDAQAIFYDLAEKIVGSEGLTAVKSCVENGEMKEEINADFAAARSYGVNGTPTFFINGKKLIGAWPYEVFESVIEAQL